MKRYFLLLGVLLLLASGVFTMSAASFNIFSLFARSPEEKKPFIVVELNGKPSAPLLVGFSKQDARQWGEDGAMLIPHTLKINLGSGRVLETPVRSSSIVMDEQVVTDVYVRLFDDSPSYAETLESLQYFLKEKGLATDQEGHFQDGGTHATARITDWSKARIHISDTVVLDIRVRTGRQGNWFALLIFGLEIEKRPGAIRLKNLRAAATQAATQPATMPLISEDVRRWQEWRKENEKIDIDELLGE